MTDTRADRIVFTHPFRLPGVEGLHAPGTYDIVVERDALDVSWGAYRLTTRIFFRSGNLVEAWTVMAADLDAALAADRPADGS
jgi:hypothetical protein